jgi:secreted Zn-dependent insulinase-like peptidase
MVKEFMKCLRPEYSLLFIQHKGFQGKTTNIEKHYKTAFNKHPFTESQLSLWQKSYDGNHPLWTTKNIHLPEPNPFIPLDFTIRNITSDPSLSSAEQEKLLLITPILIKKDANSTDLTWFKPDLFWKVPKVNVVLSLESSLVIQFIFLNIKSLTHCTCMYVF